VGGIFSSLVKEAKRIRKDVENPGGIFDPITKGFKDLSGRTARDAALAGAEELQEGALAGAEFRIAGGTEGLEALRSRLDPFANAFGADRIESLTGLATDPNQQLEFLQGNPLFNALKDQARQATFSTQSAGGGLGGSGTQQILDNQFLTLGNQLIDQQINRQLPLFQNASNISSNLGVNEANLLTDIGGFRAGGVESAAQAGATGRIGAANAQAAGTSNVLGAASTIAQLFSDERLKTNIEKIGSKNGINVYSWEWNEQGESIGLTGKGVGHIAQQVRDIHPELVTEADNGFLMINYSTDKTVSLN